MNIALDATYSIGNELSGVGVYSREILFGLAHAHPEAHFDFCYRPHRYFPSWREDLPRNVRRRLGFRSGDLFHGLNQRLPEISLQRSVATFHDLFVLTGEYSTPEFRERFAAQARDASARADALITVSQFTKDQIVSLLGIPASRITVVHHGVRSRDRNKGELIPREKIILNVGALQKRKNITRLVQAFEAVDPQWSLVLVGSSGYAVEDILARIEKSAARARIQVTGYASPATLASWYARASIFAFPSLDEGFGMPVLEAMASGVPVITSNRSALPEVAGNAAVLIDPEDTDALATTLRELCGNEDQRQELARRGKIRAQEFTWEKAVSKTWSVYRSLLD